MFSFVLLKKKKKKNRKEKKRGSLHGGRYFMSTMKFASLSLV